MNLFKVIDLHASAAETASGNSDDEEVYEYDSFVFYLHVTLVSGTSPTLDVQIDEGDDGSTWNSWVSFTQATVATDEVKRPTTMPGRYIRASWAIGGTNPSFTFALVGNARGAEVKPFDGQ